MDAPRKPPNRIDEHGNRQVAPTWESLIDRQIREAMGEGKFDDLPFTGRPLPNPDDSAAGEWAMAYRMLRNAGAPASRPASILVREAVPGDAAAIREVATAAWRSTYAGLIGDESIERFIATAYTIERVATRIDRHVVLVAGAAQGPVEAFAETQTQDDHVQVVAIYARPDARGRGLGSALLERVIVDHPGEDIAADVLVGNALAEPFYVARRFQPGELLTDEIAGEEIIERRWWLRAVLPEG